MKKILTSMIPRRSLPAPHARSTSGLLRTAIGLGLGLGLGFGLALLGTAASAHFSGPTEKRAFIIQGADVAAVKAAVQAVGGEITHELGIIHAVGAC